MLRVVIDRAKGLMDRDSWPQGKSDPYVLVFGLDKHQILRTKTIDDNLDPVWSDKPTAALDMTPLLAQKNIAAIQSSFVYFEVWNENPISDNILGCGKLAVYDAIVTRQAAKRITLEPRENEPDSKIKESRGKLGTLDINFIYEGPTIEQILAPPPPQQPARQVQQQSVPQQAPSATQPQQQPAAQQVQQQSSSAQQRSVSGNYAARSQSPAAAAAPPDNVPPANVQSYKQPKTQPNVPSGPAREVLYAQRAPPFPGNLVVVVVRATGLMNRESWGTSDPYVKVFGVEELKDAILRTPTMESTLTPEWPEAKSTALIRLENGNGTVRFQIFDSNTIKDDFMGEAVVPVTEILALPPRPTELNLPLRARAQEDDSKIQQASNQGKLGTLTVRFEYKVDPVVPKAPGEMPRQAPTGAPAAATSATSSSQMPRPLPELRPPLATPGSVVLQVLRATGLCNRETFGTSDPYVVVHDVSGAEVLRTPKVPSMLEPVFERSKSEIVLRIGNPTGAIALDVFDANPTSDDFMGEALLDVNFIISHAPGEVALPLRDRRGEKDKFILSNKDKLGFLIVGIAYTADPPVIVPIQQKSVVKSFSGSKAPMFTLPGTLTTTVVRAAGLLNLETFGTSDPYVVVTGPTNEQILRTPMAKSTLTPTWPEQQSQTILRLEKADGFLKFQVFDSNPTRDEFMGEATLPISDALARAPGEVHLPLKARPEEKDAKILEASKQLNLGTLTVKFDYVAGGEQSRPDGMRTRALGNAAVAAPINVIGNESGRLTLRVMKCDNLIPQDKMSGTSDPYFEVFYDGKSAFKSKTVKNTLSPVWPVEGNLCTMFIPDPRNPIEIMIWDEDVTTPDFQGLARLVLAQLEPTGELTLPLQPRAKEDDDNVRKAKSLGSTTVQWTYKPELAGSVRSPDQPKGVALQKSASFAPQDAIQKAGTLRITVNKCTGLINRTFSFIGCPFVKFMVNGTPAFSTVPSAEKGSDPTWRADEATLSHHLSNPLNTVLEVQVWNKGKLSDDFLGELNLNLSQLPKTGDQTLSLKPRENESESYIQKNSQSLGTIHLTWAFNETLEGPKGSITGTGNLVVQLIAVKQVLDRDVVGSMEVYGIIMHEGVEKARTSIADKSMSKQHRFDWAEGAAATLEIADPGAPIDILIFDKDVTSDDFLGQVEFIPSKNAINGEMPFALQPRPNERDSLILKERNNLGQLVLRWAFTSCPLKKEKERALMKGALPQQAQKTFTPSPAPAAPAQGLAQGPHKQRFVVTVDGAVDVLSQVYGPRTAPFSAFLTVSFCGNEYVTGMVNEDAAAPVPGPYPAQPGQANAGMAFSSLKASYPFTADESMINEAVCLQLSGCAAGGAQAQVIGATTLKWADPNVSSGSIIAFPMTNVQMQNVGLLRVSVQREELWPRGTLRLEVRNGKDFPIATDYSSTKAQMLHCDVSIGGRVHQTRPVMNDSKPFFGATLNCEGVSGSELLVLDVVREPSDEVVGRGSILIDGQSRNDGHGWVTITNPTTRLAAGMIFLSWNMETPPRKPLPQIYSNPTNILAVQHVIAEIRMLRNMAGPFAAVAYVDRHRTFETLAVPPSPDPQNPTTTHLMGDAFGFDVVKQPEPQQPQQRNPSGYQEQWKPQQQPVQQQQQFVDRLIVELVDTRAYNGQPPARLGAALIPIPAPSRSVQDSEQWYPVELNQQNGPPMQPVEVCVRLAVLPPRQAGGARDQLAMAAVPLDLTVRVLRVTALPGVQGAETRSMYLMMRCGVAEPLPSCEFVGTTERLDHNFYYPAAALPPPPGAPPLSPVPIEIVVLDMQTRSVVAQANDLVPKDIKAGSRLLHLTTGGEAEISWLWVEGSNCPRPRSGPSVLTISILEATDLRLPAANKSNSLRQIDSAYVRVLFGDVTRATSESSLPSPRAPSWASNPQVFNFVYVEDSSALVKFTVVGVAKQPSHNEETLGVGGFGADRLQVGRQWIQLRVQPTNTKGGKADQLAGSLLVEVSSTPSSSPCFQVDPVSRQLVYQPTARRGLNAQPTDAIALRVFGPVGRAYQTYVKPMDRVCDLAPYLEKHFDIPVAEQEISCGGRVVDVNATFAQNKLLPGRDQIAQLQVVSTNKKALFLQVKLPNGQLVPLCTDPRMRVWDMKAVILGRFSGILSNDLRDPQDIALKLNFREMNDDATLDYFRIAAGSLVCVSPKSDGGASGPDGRPRKAARPTGAPESRLLNITVEDPESNVGKFQVSALEPVSLVRSLVPNLNAAAEMYLNGNLIEDEDLTFSRLRADDNSYFQFRLPRNYVAPLGSSGSKGRNRSRVLLLDVEDINGNIRKVEVLPGDPVSILRDKVDCDSSNAVLLLNDHVVRNEDKTFADLEVLNGTYFSYSLNAGSPNRARRTGPNDSYFRRQRKAEELQYTVASLEERVEELRQSQQRELAMESRVADLEAQLKRSEERNKAAVERIEELEDSLNRSQTLLKRAVEFGRSQSAAYDSPSNVLSIVHRGRYNLSTSANF